MASTGLAWLSPGLVSAVRYWTFRPELPAEPPAPAAPAMPPAPPMPPAPAMPPAPPAPPAPPLPPVAADATSTSRLPELSDANRLRVLPTTLYATSRGDDSAAAPTKGGSADVYCVSCD